MISGAKKYSEDYGNRKLTGMGIRQGKLLLNNDVQIRYL